MSHLNHIAFIMDGNRRFAKRLMKEPWKGHEYGAEKLRNVLQWLRELRIHEATFYAFSSENFNRPKNEFDFLMDLFKKYFTQMITDPEIHDNKVCIRFIGELDRFPLEVATLARKLMDVTKSYTSFFVNIAFGYGGRSELTHAIKAIARQVETGELVAESISQETVEQYLYLSSQPDLIIRTGGDRRTSNFLPWQSAYSEWLFLEKAWPELSKDDVVAAVEDFNSRERRFGR